MSATETIAKLREEVATLKGQLAEAGKNGQGPKAPVLLKLGGVVNLVKETKTEEVAAGIPKGLKVSHKAVIQLTDETKLTLTRDTEPFDKVLTGDTVEVTITAPQMRLV